MVSNGFVLSITYSHQGLIKKWLSFSLLSLYITKMEATLSIHFRVSGKGNNKPLLESNLIVAKLRILEKKKNEMYFVRGSELSGVI